MTKNITSPPHADPIRSVSVHKTKSRNSSGIALSYSYVDGQRTSMRQRIGLMAGRVNYILRRYCPPTSNKAVVILAERTRPVQHPSVLQTRFRCWSQLAAMLPVLVVRRRHGVDGNQRGVWVATVFPLRLNVPALSFAVRRLPWDCRKVFTPMIGSVPSCFRCS